MVLPPTLTSRVCIKVTSYRSQVESRGSRGNTRLRKRTGALLADVQPLDQVRVALGVFGFEVVEQPAAPADEHQQPATRVVILGVRLEMFRQVIDALAENRDLYFGGSGVCVVGLVTANQLGLAGFRQRNRVCLHARPSQALPAGCAVCPKTS